MSFGGCALRLRWLAMLVGLLLPGAVNAFNISDLDLPLGYHIALYTDAVPGARQMALSPSGILFVGSLRAGVVYAVIDRDNDHVADQVVVLARDLEMPSGVAFRGGSLYVAAQNQILRLDDIEQRVHKPGAAVLVTDALPRERHHGWKFSAFGPDDRLYIPVGAPCNVCDVEPPLGSIVSMRADGSDLSIHARGIRNSVGFDWEPQSGALWFSENGRDMLGDDVPPGELNRARAASLHFGFPYVHGEPCPI